LKRFIRFSDAKAFKIYSKGQKNNNNNRMNRIVNMVDETYIIDIVAQKVSFYSCLILVCTEQ